MIIVKFEKILNKVIFPTIKILILCFLSIGCPNCFIEQKESTLNYLRFKAISKNNNFQYIMYYPKTTFSEQDKQVVLQILIFINNQLIKNHKVMKQLQNKMMKIQQKCNKVQRLTEQILHKKLSLRKRKENKKGVNEKNLNNQQIHDPIDRLFQKNKYKYTLKMINSIQSPLYTSKNFNVFLKLQNNNGQIAIHQQNILIQILVYSSKNQSQIVELNKEGSRLLHGNLFTILANGYASFQKIKFSESSKQYQSGIFHLVFIPKQHFLDKNINIQSSDIQPLVFKNLIVEA